MARLCSTRYERAARKLGWTRDVGGWYSLPGTSRTYQVEVPLEVCQKAKGFSVTVEGEDSSKFERTLPADPARCA